MNLESAFQWLLDHHDKNVDNLLGIRAKVLKKDGFPSFGPRIDREVADYMDGLGFCVRGHYEWTFRSGRYFGNGGLAPQKHRKVVLA
jgi:hypothetical protein